MFIINFTLLKNLFTEPSPQPERPEVLEIYHRMSFRMFPGKNDFISFLQVQSYDKQIELAEKIIHRLCYTSNFPPSFFALTDIICLENYQKNATSETDPYIPRDHFIHTLNLYLLGLYIFFYNAEFYRKIVASNRYERKNEVHNQPKVDSVKDFISEWKYFCLFHDIGYAQEIFGSKRFVKNARKTYKELCTVPNNFHSSLLGENTVKQTAFLGTAEIISRIFVWKCVVDYSKDDTLEESKLFRVLKISKLSSFYDGKLDTYIEPQCNLENILKDTFRFEKIYSNKCLKPLLPIIGEKNIIIIGIREDNGEVSFISVSEGNQRKLIFVNKYSESLEIKRICQDPSLVLFDDFRPVEHELEYLVKKEQSQNEFFEKSLFDEENFQLAFDYYSKNGRSTNFARISTEEQFLDFYFEIYYDVYIELRSLYSNAMESSSQIKKYMQIINRKSQLFSSNQEYVIKYKEELSKAIFSLMQSIHTSDITNECALYFRNAEIKNKSSSSTTPDELIINTVEAYFQTIKGIVGSSAEQEKLIAKIQVAQSNRIKQTASFIMMFSYIYVGLKEIFETKAPHFSYSFDYIKRESIFCDSFVNEIITSKCQKYLGSGFQAVMNEYKTRDLFDHGFESTKYAASIFELLRNSIASPKKAEEWMLIDILFSISNPYKKREFLTMYIDNYNHIFSEVLYSIFIHNIYPNCFPTTSPLYNIQTIIANPFAYLVFC